MGTETIMILLLLIFILGMIIGVVLARPTHVHQGVRELNITLWQEQGLGYWLHNKQGSGYRFDMHAGYVEMRLICLDSLHPGSGSMYAW